MQKIPLQLATEGMVLAREVCRKDSPNSVPICGKDTILTDALITRLDHMDIKTVYVKGHPLLAEGDRTLDQALSELDLRFEQVCQDPLMAKIHDIYADYLRRVMGDDSGR